MAPTYDADKYPLAMQEAGRALRDLIRRNTVKLKDGSGELLINGVAGYLAYYIDLLPDVLRVKPTVRGKGKSIHTTLYVEIAPGVNVLEKSSKVRETAHQVLEEQLGLQVNKEIKVIIKPVPHPKVRRATKPSLVHQKQPSGVKVGTELEDFPLEITRSSQEKKESQTIEGTPECPR